MGTRSGGGIVHFKLLENHTCANGIQKGRFEADCFFAFPKKKMKSAIHLRVKKIRTERSHTNREKEVHGCHNIDN